MSAGEGARMLDAPFDPESDSILGIQAIYPGREHTLFALGLLLQRWVKVPEPAIVAVAALAGIFLHN
jgi:hypothetical protein